MDTLKKEIPDYVLMPYCIPERSLPVMLDSSPSGYGDGKYRRRMRREKERQNKKRKNKKRK